MHSVDHGKNIIECKDVCFSYDGQDILHDVTFAIHRGDYLGIVGPNGGGKTTLLKILLGLLKSNCGTVKLFNTDIRAFKDWSKIGYVPQKVTQFDPNFPATVGEVVMMGRFAKRGLLHGVTDEDRKHVTDALQKVEMHPFTRRLIGDLSGGQQQRVFIARAIACEPEVVILDEPTTGVDRATQDDFYALLRKLNLENDLTLVLATHDSEIIQREATEIAYVNRTLEYRVNKQYA